MFNAFETKFGYNKLLLLVVLLDFSPLSQALKSSKALSSATDNLIGKRDFDLIFESFICTTNEDDDNVAATAKTPAPPSSPKRAKLLKKLACHLSRNVKRRYLQMEMSFERQINQFDFDISITMQRPPHAPEPEFVLLNFTALNGCEFLSNRNQVVLMNLVRKSLERYSNIPSHCPLSPQISYYIRNYRWDMEQMPAFYVEAPVRVDFAYTFEKTTRVRGTIEAKLELRSNKKFAAVQ